MNRRSRTQADMLNDHETININNVSISAAAKEYGVPRMTVTVTELEGNFPWIQQ